MNTTKLTLEAIAHTIVAAREVAVQQGIKNHEVIFDEIIRRFMRMLSIDDAITFGRMVDE